MVNPANSRKLTGHAPPSSFAMRIDPPSAPTSPTTTTFRSRTLSSPAHTKTPDGNPTTTDDRQDTSDTPFPNSSFHDSRDSKTNLNEASRARRSSTTTSTVHFSIPKTFSMSSPLGFFSRRRKSIQHPPSRPPDDTLGEVIEIGPDPGRLEDGDASVIHEDEERERLRDAAAQALGLGLGRDSSGTPEPTLEDMEVGQTTPVVGRSTNPYVLDPIPRIPPLTGLTASPPSLVSLPNSHSQLAPSIMTTSSDAVPPYPSTLSALKPYIQTSSSLFKYHPGSTFLALTLSRRAKQWKLHYVVLTSPPPAKSPTHDFADFAQRPNPEMSQLRAEMLQISNGEFMPLPSTRHSHLHLFKSASPAPEELEIDRLEINEDSVVYVTEVEVAGKRDVVKVGGRDARRNPVGSGGASFKSTGSSWHGSMKADNEANMEEMGRTMWWLKMTDGPEMQEWMGHIRTAVFMQRAERAGMFQQHAPSTVPSMRADLDVLLSLRSQALLPNIASSSGTATPPYPGYTAPSMDTISQANPTHPSQAPSSRLSTQKPPLSYNHTSFTNAAGPIPSPTPNPRYAEHVGAAPSHASPSSIRARTYPPPSALSHGLPSLKSLFSPSSSQSSAGFGHVNGNYGIPSSKGASSSRQGSRPSSPQLDNEKDIDPISDEVVSLGNRATALLNLFRSTSRASNSHNQYTGMGNNSTMTTMPASTTRSHGIGTPISPVGYTEETLRGKPSGVDARPTAYSVDWSTMNDGSTPGSLSKQTSSGAPSLPPPPRHPRRPMANGIIPGKTMDTTSHQMKRRVNGTAHGDREGSGPERRPSSSHDRHTPSPSILSPPTSAPSIPGSSSFRGGRPPSANSSSSYVSAEGDRSSEVERGNSMRRSRTVPKMLAPPAGPPPSAPSLRARSPSGPPSPILEQDVMQRNGSGRLEPSSGPTSTWGSQHPYSNRVSGSSALSVKTTSTGHSFFGSKAPPPPRPPPNFSPPPAPTEMQDAAVATSAHRESVLSRSLRLSLVPPAAPPTQSLPPRPDEPGYRHRRSHSSDVHPTGSLYPIPASSSPPSFITHPPAPPPSGPLPPTPDSDRDRPSSRNSRHTSLTQRLRIMSSPSPASLTQSLAKEAMVDSRRLIGEPILSHSDGYPAMFLNMSDTPITPAVSQPPPFLPVPSPLQSEQEDIEPTPLSPPPRRNSRNSKEIRPPNHERDDTKSSPHPGAGLGPRDCAVYT